MAAQEFKVGQTVRHRRYGWTSQVVEVNDLVVVTLYDPKNKPCRGSYPPADLEIIPAPAIRESVMYRYAPGLVAIVIECGTCGTLERIFRDRSASGKVRLCDDCRAHRKADRPAPKGWRAAQTMPGELVGASA